jgi:hypothetical protein
VAVLNNGSGDAQESETVSEHDDRAAKDQDVDIPSSDRGESELQAPCTATLKREEDVEADDRDHSTGASQAATNREEDLPA